MDQIKSQIWDVFQKIEQCAVLNHAIVSSDCVDG